MLLGADKITVLKNLYKAIEDVVGSGGEEVGIILEAIEELNTKVEALEVATGNIASLSDKVEALEVVTGNIPSLSDKVDALEVATESIPTLSGKVEALEVATGDIPTLSDKVDALEVGMSNLSGLSGYKVGGEGGDIPTVSAVEVMIGEAIDAISGGE